MKFLLEKNAFVTAVADVIVVEHGVSYLKCTHTKISLLTVLRELLIISTPTSRARADEPARSF